jgi:Family of unknown function (DUF6295)
MCTYLTEKVSISGSGKGPSGWFRLTDASVYFDHPVHAQAEHTLNIDFLDPGAGPAARVAVELTAESARALAKAIQATLDAAPTLLAGGTIPQGPQSGGAGMSVARASMHVRPPLEGGSRGLEAAANADHRRAGCAG